MGKITSVEIENAIATGSELSVRIKHKGEKSFSKPIILKGKGVKKDERQVLTVGSKKEPDKI